MVLEFPNDPVCANLDMQYMLGESLLVAPIFNAQSKAEFYLPKGVFTDILTGRKVQGGTYITENHSYMSIPLFVRENTVITTGSCDTKPDYDYCDGVTLNVFELASSTACEVSGIGGEIEFIAHFAVDGKDVQIDTQGRNSNYKVLLWNVDNISELKGALSEKTDKGILLTSCDACVSFKMN
jgi:alpha-D-xyloside xylohydrolase